MNTFFGDNYKMPTTGNYMRLGEGNNKFRILSSAITGWIYFTTENKPIRSATPFDETPGIKHDGKINHFWSFVVYNVEADKVQVLEISQKSIQEQMKSYLDDKEWGVPNAGEPFGYDFNIVRKGTGKMDTEYKVITSPHKPIASEIVDRYKKMDINLSALYEGKDPFKSE